ncbi:MAG: FtsQ-type POTRA domain-containing protein [Oscillospiraceae bacterium]|nr:FtsQ-type POTRA domain-containing protein [Oscillospiraceae bacterium]
MAKNERRNSTQNMKKAGISHPSKAVSDSDKFIQYPGGGSTVSQPPRGRKNLSPRPPQDNHRKSRKTVRKQRNRHLLATVVLVAILLAICIFISLKVLFIVRHVEMEGSERYTREEIINYCAVPLEENIFKIDTAVLEQNLPAEFTYVESARVQRKLPDKILITITDSVPTYYGINYEGELTTYTIYSQNFKTLTTQAAVPDGLTGIDADLSDEKSRRILDDIISKLQQTDYTGVTMIMVDREGNITLVYDDRLQIRLGTMLDIDYKLKMSFYIVNNELTETDRGIIDSTQAGSCVFQPEV